MILPDAALSRFFSARRTGEGRTGEGIVGLCRTIAPKVGALDDTVESDLLSALRVIRKNGTLLGRLERLL